TASTPIFGVVGWPIAHTLSPHIHNAGFDATDTDAIYVPLAVKPDYDAFRTALDALRTRLKIGGLSVTIPHKENALRYVKEIGGEIDPLSARIGVINTIVFAADGVRGFNTD